MVNHSSDKGSNVGEVKITHTFSHNIRDGKYERNVKKSDLSPALSG